MVTKKRRAVILLGAGASLEYGAPSTPSLTDEIRAKVLNDPVMQKFGSADAYKMIEDRLKTYLVKPGVVHFEQIFHCAHELAYSFEPITGAFDEFRPILVPFLERKFPDTQQALKSLASFMAEAIFETIAERCAKPQCSLVPLSNFLDSMRDQFCTRIYSTNYDDFPLQAAPNLYTGFHSGAATPYRFDLNEFWKRENDHCLLHLHGSVHIAFKTPPVDDFAELWWFPDISEAVQHRTYSGGGRRRMDGSETIHTALVTGFDKLGRLQERPLSHFYASMMRDVMRADVIFVIGSGLGDLHLNALLHEARSRQPPTPLLFVDFWKNGFPPVWPAVCRSISSTVRIDLPGAEATDFTRQAIDRHDKGYGRERNDDASAFRH